VSEPELPNVPEVRPDVETEVETGVEPARRRVRYRPRHHVRSRRLLLVAILSVLALAGVGIGSAAFIGKDDDRPDPAASRTGSTTPSITAAIAPSASPSTVGVVRATVPDLIGLRIGRAASALQDAGLMLGSVTTVPGPAGVVVRTDPTPGEAVLAASVVDVFVGNGAG
jgi:hypothetical protein